MGNKNGAKTGGILYVQRKLDKKTGQLIRV